MKTLEPYIKAIKEKLNLPSYMATMEHLGMHRQAWTSIQKGAGVNENNAIRMAKILNIDPMEIVAISMSLKAKNKESRNFWIKWGKYIENQQHTVDTY